MNRALLSSASLTLAAFAACPALANDTMAELKAGGLIYTTAYNVEMKSEDLFLSTKAVKVDYVFHNSGDRDETTVVAFPMPDVEGSADFTVTIPNDNSDNFMDFSVSVEGQPVTPNVDRHAYATEIDVTALLNEHAIPLLPYGDATIAALDKLPQPVLDDWTQRGMVYRNEYDAGQGAKVDWVPLWRLKTTYWWQMTFPAGHDLHVAHRYKPSVGATTGLNFLSWDTGKAMLSGPNFEEEKAKYCFDSTFVKTVTKRLAALENDEHHSMQESWMAYVLTTGANWGGTIGDYHLTVDKGDPDTLVSFCGDGIKKTGPTTFEVRAKDYYPDKDINIALITTGEY
jgi:hypothetical protein